MMGLTLILALYSVILAGFHYFYHFRSGSCFSLSFIPTSLQNKIVGHLIFASQFSALRSFQLFVQSQVTFTTDI